MQVPLPSRSLLPVLQGGMLSLQLSLLLADSSQDVSRAASGFTIFQTNAHPVLRVNRIRLIIRGYIRHCRTAPCHPEFVVRLLPNLLDVICAILNETFFSPQMLARRQRHGYVGGGRRGNVWSSIEQFVISVPFSFDIRSTLLYAAHIDDADLPNYPPQKYVQAMIPLSVMANILTLSTLRSVAELHGIEAGSRANAATIRSYIVNTTVLNASNTSLYSPLRKVLLRSMQFVMPN